MHDLIADQLLLPDDDYFWKEGMPVWRPLTDLPLWAGRPIAPPRSSGEDVWLAHTPASAFLMSLESPVGAAVLNVAGEEARAPLSYAPRVWAPAPAAARKGRNGREGRDARPLVNPSRLSTTAAMLMLVTLLLLLIHVLMVLDAVNGWFSNAPADPTLRADLGLTPTLTPGLAPGEIIAFAAGLAVLLGFFAASEIAFLRWVHRVNRNCRSLTSSMRYSSAWAVGLFLVPGYNLFRPYEVMQDIWKVSTRPRAWSGQRDSILVAVWFAARLVAAGVILVACVAAAAGATSPEPGVRAIGWFLHGAAVEGSLALILVTGLALVGAVTTRQMRLIRE
ncbi:MAG: DUF4328 domain-containing protein [Verrucomicrobiota bacterium]